MQFIHIKLGILLKIDIDSTAFSAIFEIVSDGKNRNRVNYRQSRLQLRKPMLMYGWMRIDFTSKAHTNYFDITLLGFFEQVWYFEPGFFVFGFIWIMFSLGSGRRFRYFYLICCNINVFLCGILFQGGVGSFIFWFRAFWRHKLGINIFK